MFDQSRTSLQGHDITLLGPYKPWTYHKENGGNGGDYPEHSGRILDVKEARAAGLTYFTDYMAPRIKQVEAIAVVPSHDPEKQGGGVQQLCAALAVKVGIIDASGALVRHTKINKLANGGDRSITVHLNSIHVPTPELVAGKTVLLIDDVMTSGNSLLACRQLLLQAGAAKVGCAALGRTTY